MHAKYGDLVHVCGLAEPFLRHHGSQYPIKLVVSHDLYRPIIALFGDAISEVIAEPTFSNTPGDWNELSAALQLPAFGLNVPIKLQPNIDEFSRRAVDFCNQHRIPWTKLYKSILHLPDSTAPIPAVSADADTLIAGQWCEQNGFKRGRTVVLFPYAQSFPVESKGHFAALAAELVAKGFHVLTSVGPGEEPISGTAGVFIPFSLLIEAVSYAGWAVVIRSGIADIIASARCRKTIIYRSSQELRVWSLRLMELCGDADEMIIDFNEVSEEQFASFVTHPVDFAPLVNSPGGLASVIKGYLSDHVALEHTYSPKISQQDGPPGGAGRSVSVAVELDGLFLFRDVPPRGDFYGGAGVKALREDLISALEGGAHGYATTDEDHLGEIETLTPGSLVNGSYVAADKEHTLIVCATPLSEMLPAVVARYIRRSNSVRTDEVIDISSATLDADGARQGIQSFDGLQLIGGWGKVEDWGVWSVGRTSRMGLSYPSSTSCDATLFLEIYGFVSPISPTVGFTIAVDEDWEQRVELRLGTEEAELHIPLRWNGRPGVQSHLITFHFDPLSSPAQQGLSGDTRELGFGLRRARVVQVPTVAQ